MAWTLSIDVVSRAAFVLCLAYLVVFIALRRKPQTAKKTTRTADATIPPQLLCCSSCTGALNGRGGRSRWKHPTGLAALLLKPFLREAQCPLDTTQKGIRVIPIPPVDQQYPIDSSIIHVFFAVPHLLDEPRLRDALDDLVRKRWPKLGARLARRPDGVLEYRIPERFHADYELFSWSSARHPHGLEEIPGIVPPATTLPEGGVRLQARPGEWEGLTTVLSGPRERWPRDRLEASGDQPLVTVHVSSFSDGKSVLGLCIPHPVADQMGVGCIMKAWLGLVGGTAPPPMQGYPPRLNGGQEVNARKVRGEEDLESGIGGRQSVGSIQEKGQEGAVGSKSALVGRLRIFSWFGKGLFMASHVLELMLSPIETHGTIFLPTKLVQDLRGRISKEIQLTHNEDDGKVSEGDVVSAILCKLANMHRHLSLRPVTLGVVVNLRGRIPELARGGTSYVHNALVYGFARLGRFDFNKTTLAEVAYRQRIAVSQSITPEHIEASLGYLDESFPRGNPPPMLGDPGSRSFVVSNWSAAWRDLDFGAAAQGSSGVSGEGTRPLVLGRAHPRWTPMRFVSMVMCKTDDGYWASFSATPRDMRRVEEFLTRDALLESL